jgi:spermidine synthase
MLILYSLTLFLSATLLFTVEPMVGKMLLPRCGGTPSVWNTCMVFFQMALLLGYGYSHVTTKFLGVRRQAVFHLFVILLPLLVLPVLFNANITPPAEGNQSFWLLRQLTLVVGLPFFVLSTTAPLLQKWFAGLGHAASRDPYFLYSTSNAGSLLALLAYPFVIEPNIGLISQTTLWHAGYVLLVVLIASCAIALWRASRTAATISDDAEQAAEKCATAVPVETLTFGRRLMWVLLAFVPSSLMLGVTTHIATDIASVPLLWVLPLAIYLLTFIIVFARKPILPHSLMITAMAFAVLLMPLFSLGVPLKFWMAVPIHLLTFFIVAMVCHGEMARTRPGASHLTEFYFWMSLGGVLGGLFNSLAAPLIFHSVLEYPLMLVAACFLRPARRADASRKAFDIKDFAWLVALVAAAVTSIWAVLQFPTLNPYVANGIIYGIPAVICFSFTERRVRFALGVGVVFIAVGYFAGAKSGNVLWEDRNFFGVNRVCISADKQFHMLVNGNTIHGLQRVDPEPSREPIGYYCRSGPLGDVFKTFAGPMLKQRVGVIGLGSGGMAAYAQSEQQFTFYEIDPAVEVIARDPKLFTYLHDCSAKWDIVLGDARIRLADAPDRSFDMIILDAFSSDSIPLHLLTKEAMNLYLGKLKPDGVLVMHISNRYLDLEPVLGQLAAAEGLACFSRRDTAVSAEEQKNGKRASEYVVMAHKANDLGSLVENKHWKQVKPLNKVRFWTDDYSNILSVLQW